MIELRSALYGIMARARGKPPPQTAQIFHGPQTRLQILSKVYTGLTLPLPSTTDRRRSRMWMPVETDGVERIGTTCGEGRAGKARNGPPGAAISQEDEKGIKRQSKMLKKC